MMGFIKKLEQSRRIEEILGAIGLAYIVFIFATGFVLVGFLAGIVTEINTVPQAPTETDIGQYNIEAARETVRN